MRKQLAAVITGATMLVTPTLANAAACVQADLNGTWQAYMVVVSESGGGWVRCILDIEGEAIASTSCAAFFGVLTNLPLTNGTAKVSSPANCTVTTKFKLAGKLHKMIHGTMTISGDSVNGVGTIQGRGGLIMNMTKM